MLKILVVFGTRPEAIKLAPLILGALEDDQFDVRVCSTGQHMSLLTPVLDFFGISPDFNLSVMREGQSLTSLSSEVLMQLESVFDVFEADFVVVQGDTSTCFVAALAAFYHQRKVVHIEAGLRTLDLYSPFPEEMNRVLTSRIAELHFAPTEVARDALASEGIRDGVFVVGNTGIDAVMIAKERLSGDAELFRERFSEIDFSRRVLLVSMHRRENFGMPVLAVSNVLRQLLDRYSDIEIVFSVHPNPCIRDVVLTQLEGVDRVHLLDPPAYPEFVFLMGESAMILTDSGGIQEEAPALGVPVLVLRDVSERMEAVELGAARLVGTDEELVFAAVSGLLDSPSELASMRGLGSPYGDGESSGRILGCLRSWGMLG